MQWQTFQGLMTLDQLTIARYNLDQQSARLWWNDHDNGSRIWTSLSANGLNMNSNKITGLANGTAATDAAAFGQLTASKVVQYITVTSTTNFATSSSTFQDTHLSLNITPGSSSNKILLLASATGKATATGSVGFFVTFAKGGTNLLGTSGQAEFNSGSSVGACFFPWSMVYLDSPAATTSQTYSVQVKNSDNATSFEMPGSANTTQFMIALEVLP